MILLPSAKTISNTLSLIMAKSRSASQRSSAASIRLRAASAWVSNSVSFILCYHFSFIDRPTHATPFIAGPAGIHRYRRLRHQRGAGLAAEAASDRQTRFATCQWRRRRHGSRKNKYKRGEF
jgi:hypothetical protein